MDISNPEFPANRHNLVNGSIIVSAHPRVAAELGVPVGKELCIGWTGQYVRHLGFTWDVEDICQEIDAGYWTVADKKVNLENVKERIGFQLACSPN